MSDDRDKKAYELFEKALEREAGERDAFLDEACAGDAGLRAEVESLLAADAGAGSFLSPPPVKDDELLDQVHEAAGPGSSEGDGVAEETLTADTRTAMPHPTAPHPTPHPKRLGQYHIKSVITSGGMGTVYEATQEKPRRTVAVKVMKHGIVSPSLLRRFEYESQVLARLRHPGIAQVYDAGTHRDESGVVPYFAMEYIPNAKSITRYADEKKLGTRERMSLFADVCDAVHHGHQKGVIHRDLKPSNILVDPSGQVKIIDFGVARGTDSDMAVTTLQTDVGQLIGTLQYMSPEQCNADPHDLDIRSDVYALGVVFFELLCGRLPYDVAGMAIHQATQAIREQSPTKLSTLNRTLRGDVETIALKALEKDRDRRYQAAADFAQDIRRYNNNEAITARPPSMIYHVRVFARRNKPLVGAVISVFVVLIAATIVSSVQYFKAEGARKVAEAAREEAEENLATARATRDFTLDIIDHLGRAAKQKHEVTPLGLLNQFGEWISEGRLASEPLFEANVRLVLGRWFVGSGDFQAAEEQFDKSLAIRQRELDEPHQDIYRAMQLKAWVLNLQNRFADALPLARESLDGLNSIPGSRRLYRNISFGAVQASLENLKKYKELEASARSELEIRTRELGKEHRATVEALDSLQHALCLQEKFEEARPYAIELIGHRKRAAEEPDAGPGALNRYAKLLMTCEPEDLRDPAAALPVAQRAVEMTESKNAGVLDTLAMAYFMTSDTAKAIETQEKAVSLVPAEESETRTELEANLAKYRAGSTMDEPAAKPTEPGADEAQLGEPE